MSDAKVLFVHNSIALICFEYVTAFSQGSDLVADWHLDEGTGVTAVDSSGNQSSGEIKQYFYLH